MSDTIAAIVTPAGEGGVSIIRISGDRSVAIASELFQARHKTGETAYSPKRVYFGEIIDPQSSRTVDEVLLTYFKAPQSYTAEDVVEISTHGGVFVSAKVLQIILNRHARLAEPGEFTRRAFLNGRIDLSQAEAVTDLIHAVSEKAHQASVSQLKGNLSSRINELIDRLLAVLAQLEAAIDFPEEGLKFQNKEETVEQIRKVEKDLTKLIDTYLQGKIFREGTRAALVGKPNTGKSSLLNALLMEDRAIVTPIPGTTRDTLEERVRIKDIHINIVDAAGLRKDPEVIEEQGIQRARAALDRADLALVIFDLSQPLDENDRLLIEAVQEKHKLIVLNKCDLPQKLDIETLSSHFPENRFTKISATQGNGLEELSEAIYEKIMSGKTVEEPVVITRERHRQCLLDGREGLRKSLESLTGGLTEEFVAEDVNYSLQRLGSILGKTFEEDLLDQIFGEFCIGK